MDRSVPPIAKSCFAALLGLCCVLPLRAQETTPCKVLDPELQAQYRGGCRSGLAHGTGAAAGSATYEGEFRNGMKHGAGVKTWAWGDRYAGEFANDRKHGQGVYTWGKGTQWAGERYEGEFVNDQRHGFGVYTWPNADRYEGGWTTDGRHGLAAMETRRDQARAAQLEAFKPGVSICLLNAAVKAEIGLVKGVVDAFDGAQLSIRLAQLPPGLSQGRAAGFQLGQVVVDEPVNWAPCL